MYFIPDVVGSYTVNMTATSDSGAHMASVVITAAKFKGVGAYRPTTQSYQPFNCSPCHSQTSGTFATFLKTNHASASQRKFDTDGGHFASYCMPCHTASTQAGGSISGSYSTYATALGFTVPHNGAGVWDSLLTVADANALGGNDSLLTLMGLASIQCESCHGPAGEHAATGNPALMGKKHGSDVCAPCHFSSDRHPKGYSWENSLHAIAQGEGAADPNYMNRNSCSRCHVGQGFVNETINGNPPPSNYADPQGIGCSTCHDPHSNEGMEYQLYRKTVADACTGCHTTRLSSYSGLHHSHQGQMIQGVQTAQFTGDFSQTVADVAGWTLPGYKYENSFHSTIEERCVQCHMANTPDFDPTFASPDTLLDKVGGHTWKIKWTDVNGTHINNVGCAGAECHGGTVADVTAFTEGSQHAIQVLLDTLKNNLPLRPLTGSNPGLPK